MNPEENTNDQPAAPTAATPDATPAPETTPEPVPEAPSLDQVAADLTSAAETNNLESTSSNTEDTPAPATDAPFSTPDMSQAAAPTDSPAVGSDSHSGEDGEEHGGSFEGEIPLTPADPVPGSIGSSLAYSETAPNHSVPVEKGKNHKRAPFELFSKKPDPTFEPMPAPAPAPEPAPEAAPAPATPAPAEQPVPEQPAPVPEPAPAPAEQPAVAEQPSVAEQPAPAEAPAPTPVPIAVPTPEPEPVYAADSIVEPAAGAKKPLFRKDNLKLILIIGLAIVLIAVVVIVMLFIFSGSNSNKSSNSNNSANTASIEESKESDSSSSKNSSANKVSSLTCTKKGGADVFPTFGSVVSGKEDVVAMYAGDELTSFGTNLNLEYANADDAEAGLEAARQNYKSILANYNFSTDPFTSEYNADGDSITVTHQADGDEIDATNAKIFGFYVIRGEVATDIDTLTDMFESNSYTCSTKQ